MNLIEDYIKNKYNDEIEIQIIEYFQNIMSSFTLKSGVDETYEIVKLISYHVYYHIPSKTDQIELIKEYDIKQNYEIILNENGEENIIEDKLPKMIEGLSNLLYLGSR